MRRYSASASRKRSRYRQRFPWNAKGGQTGLVIGPELVGLGMWNVMTLLGIVYES